MGAGGQHLCLSLSPLSSFPGHSRELTQEAQAGLPVQPKHLAAVFCGHDAPEGPGITPRVHDWQDALDAATLAAARAPTTQAAWPARARSWPKRRPRLN